MVPALCSFETDLLLSIADLGQKLKLGSYGQFSMHVLLLLDSSLCLPVITLTRMLKSGHFKLIMSKQHLMSW